MTQEQIEQQKHEDLRNYLKAIRETLAAFLTKEEQMQQVIDLVTLYQQLKKSYATKR